MCHGPADALALDLLVQKICDEQNNQNLQFVGRDHLIARPARDGFIILDTKTPNQKPCV